MRMRTEEHLTASTALRMGQEALMALLTQVLLHPTMQGQQVLGVVEQLLMVQLPMAKADGINKPSRHFWISNLLDQTLGLLYSISRIIFPKSGKLCTSVLPS